MKSRAAVLLASLVIPAIALAQHPSALQVVGFGDSLSDPGNFFALTGQQSLAPYAPVPSAPYAIGGQHFSNGATWLEKVTTALNDTTGGKPAFAHNDVFANFAIGGARARPSGGAPDLTTQVGAYLSRNAWSADGAALHSIWFGSNDARDALALLSAATTPAEVGAAFAVITEAVGTIRNNISVLHASGARSFIVANLPNLGSTPAARAGGPQSVTAATFVSAMFNAELEAALNGLDGLTDIEIHRLDIWTLLNSVYASPESFGLSDVTSPCLRFGVLTNHICSSPQSFLYWDTIHPTTAGHGILAEEAIRLLTSH